MVWKPLLAARRGAMVGLCLLSAAGCADHVDHRPTVDPSIAIHPDAPQTQLRPAASGRQLLGRVDIVLWPVEAASGGGVMASIDQPMDQR